MFSTNLPREPLKENLVQQALHSVAIDPQKPVTADNRPQAQYSKIIDETGSIFYYHDSQSLDLKSKGISKPTGKSETILSVDDLRDETLTANFDAHSLVIKSPDSADGISTVKPRSSSLPEDVGEKTETGIHPKSLSLPSDFFSSNDVSAPKVQQIAKKTIMEGETVYALLNEGAAKEVYRIQATKDPGKLESQTMHAFLVPRSDGNPVTHILKEREIQAEVKVAASIRKELYRQDLAELTKNLRGLKKETPELMAQALTENFMTIDDLIDALMNLSHGNVDEKNAWLKLDKVEAQAVLLTLSDPRNANKLKALKESGAHLALHLEELTGSERLGGQYTVKTLLAQGSLDKFIIDNPDLKFEERMELISQFFKGMSDLHRAGYVHGDIKPDNILIFRDDKGKIHLRISDLGKTIPLRRGLYATQFGNHRYMGPEEMLSQEGEVYGSAFVAIRMIEELFLPKEPIDLTEIGVGSSKVEPPKEERRGIEKFVVDHPDCPHDVHVGLIGTFRSLTKTYTASQLNWQPTAETERTHTAISSYIDLVVIHLKEAYPEENFPHQQILIRSLDYCLRTMTEADPQQRTSMAEVVDFLEPAISAFKIKAS